MQGSYGVWKSVEKGLAIFQPGKIVNVSFSMEKVNNFPDLIF